MSDASLSAVRVVNPDLFGPWDEEGIDMALSAARKAMGEILRVAFHGERFPAAEAVAAWLAENVSDEAVALFVVHRGDEFRGLGLIADWPSPFQPFPCVLHIYAPKDREARFATAGLMADWARHRGHATVCALNQSGMDDAVWLAAFKPIAAGRVVASYVHFDLGG